MRLTFASFPLDFGRLPFQICTVNLSSSPENMRSKNAAPTTGLVAYSGNIYLTYEGTTCS